MENITHDTTKVKPLRFYPELSLTALQKKWDKELALWYQLKALNIQGNGLLFPDEVINALVPLFYSKTTFLRLLRAGDGFLWQYPCETKSGKKIRLFSLFHVCRFFDMKHLSRPVEILFENFRSRQEQRAWFYASFFKQKKKNPPISRKSIQEATGISKRKQLRWETAISVKKKENFAFKINPAGKIVPAFSIVEGKNRLYSVRKQLGNSYQTIASPASGAFVGKINRWLHGLAKVERPAMAKRYFFPSPGLGKKLSKRDRDREAFLWIGTGKWCLVE